jgi:hypothetical protein
MSTFYRIVKTDPPTEWDFLSHQARGLPLRHDTPERRRSWERVSVYDTPERARVIARRFPAVGPFIAEVQVNVDGPVAFERSGEDPRHFDLDGEPAEMLKLATRVIPV